MNSIESKLKYSVGDLVLIKALTSIDNKRQDLSSRLTPEDNPIGKIGKVLTVYPVMEQGPWSGGLEPFTKLYTVETELNHGQRVIDFYYFEDQLEGVFTI